MCGRFTLTTPAQLLREAFGIGELPGFRPRYNIAPAQPVSLIRGPEPTWGQARWGLIPFWSKDPAMGNRMINARAETLQQRPAYREPFLRRRCLIPADGFYEWQRVSSRRKQPWYLRRHDKAPFAFAGLWDLWHDPASGAAVESCCLITTEANVEVAPIHDRMPVILQPEQYAVWLDPERSPEHLRDLLRPATPGLLYASPVSTWVNDPRHDDPRCLQTTSWNPGDRTVFR